MSAKSMAPASRMTSLVHPEEFRRVGQNVVVAVDLRGEALRVQKALLGAGDDVQDVGLLVPPHLARVENVPLLRRVPELEILRQPGQSRAPPEMTKAKAVKRRDRQLAIGLQRERPRDARLHVVRGLLGEGQRQDALLIGSLPHQVDEAPGQGRGLAGAGTGKNQLDAPGCRRRGLLRWIERAHLHHRDCSTANSRRYRRQAKKI